MLSQRLEAALNAQVNAEFWSAYLYLSMSNDFTTKSLPGFANWMYIQFQEEQAHALKIMNYIIARGGKAKLAPIAEVKTEWDSALAMYEETLVHEKKVTSLINDLYSIATEEKDYSCQSMLKFFIDEQVEEEEAALGIVDALKMIGDNGYGLYSLDKEMSARVFTPIVIK